MCQDQRGFVYLKVDDSIIFELNKIFKGESIPPYFGKGKAGGHITIIPAGELPLNTPLPDIGKTIQFSIPSSIFDIR